MAILRSGYLVVLALVIGCAAGCGHSSGTSGENRKLVLTGSSTIAPLASDLAKRFEQEHPGVRIDVQTGGSSRGVSDTRQGLNDIGLVSRPLKEDEKDLHAFAIANDGVTVILHKSNPVTSLSDAQIVDIYRGKITRWNDVGGNDAAITVVNKSEGRSTLELFCEHFKLKNSEIKAHVIIGDNEQGIKTVAGNPNAIGYVSIGTAEYDAAHGTPIKLLPIGGIEASSENVANGKFPLARPLNLITKSPPEGLAKEFIDFATSDKVNDLIKGQSFVPLQK
jgi:phosphate transport system substrate-binding protein